MRYRLQAAIAACHATVATPADIDRREIATLHERLERLVPSAVVALKPGGRGDQPRVAEPARLRTSSSPPADARALIWDGECYTAAATFDVGGAASRPSTAEPTAMTY